MRRIARRRCRFFSTCVSRSRRSSACGGWNFPICRKRYRGRYDEWNCVRRRKPARRQASVVLRNSAKRISPNWPRAEHRTPNMTHITRRQAAAGLGAVGALSVLPRRARADLAALEDAARKEATVTWYTAQMSGEAAEDMGRIFTRKYPGISVTVIRTTGQVAYQRVLQELKNSTPQCDVFCSTDNSHYPALKARGALAQYKPHNAGALAQPFVGLGDDGYYVPATASLQAMVYHTRNVK